MKKTKKIEFSSFQKRLFWEIQKGEGHIIVEARAGSGKSFSIVESFKFVPRGKKVIVLAFNKIIAEEMREKAPSYIQDVSTFHSLGLRAIRQRFQSVEIDDWKVFNIVKEFPECQGDNGLIFNICDTIAYCKYGLIDSPREIDDLISRFGMDTCELERQDFIRIVIQALGKDKAMTHKVDYNDMCYLPFVYDLPLGSFDLVYIDERQDLNRSNMAMAIKLCKKDGGRIIAVGDTFQELYSWRLSDSSIIDEMKKKESTKTLSLPISYRCPKKVIELIKPFVSDITCPETAKEGSIEEISLAKLYDIAKPGCFILSRVNAPLIKICMSFIKNKIKANIRGKNDIGKQLVSIIRRSKKKQVPAFLKWLQKWKEEEVAKLIEKEIKIDNLIDRYECLVDLCEEASSMDEVKVSLDNLFNENDEKKVIILSSVHGAKGLERDNVFLLRWTFRSWFDDIVPGTDESGNEELRISYVAASRSKDKLYLVNKT